jgi:pyruvate kinase
MKKTASDIDAEGRDSSSKEELLAQLTPWTVTAKLHFRRTKIVATIGPASSSPAMLRALIRQGLDIARINFSHGEPEDHLKVIRRIRQIASASNKIVSILGDLCGPKIRVGKFKNGQVTLKDGSKVLITEKGVLGDEQIIPSQCKGIEKEIRAGDRVLLDDGNLEFKVLRKVRGGVEALVVHGGVLKDKKGMNLPDTKLSLQSFTAKDKKDALYCIKGGADFIALSFVRSAHDITDLKRFLARHKSDIPVIAKIEKPEALDDIDEIIAVADGIMIARGDLGVELPPQKVPLIQSRLIEKANQQYKPVIVATQMLESMTEHARPTRAEVTDVSMACIADADAVMLSGETASGKFPLETLKMMDSILRETEAYQFFAWGGLFKKRTGFRRDELLNAIGAATAQISRDLKVRCISVLTRSGRTARVVSADRPAAPVFALTYSDKVARRLNLLWGVYPIVVPGEMKFREFIRRSESTIKDLHLAQKHDYIILLSGLPESGSVVSNSMTIHKVR